MIAAAANFKFVVLGWQLKAVTCVRGNKQNYLYRFKYLQHDVRTSWLSIYSIDCCKKPERKTKKKKLKLKPKTNITLRKITKHNSKKDKKYANHQNRMRVRK